MLPDQYEREVCGTQSEKGRDQLFLDIGGDLCMHVYTSTCMYFVTCIIII